jgi:hypothetical protein
MATGAVAASLRQGAVGGAIVGDDLIAIEIVGLDEDDVARSCEVG